MVIHVLEEPLRGELWVGLGLCDGLDVSLLEVVGLGLTTCEEAGVVKGVHLHSVEVRSVTSSLKAGEEVQEEVQEIKDEWEDEEVEENGGLKVEEIRSSRDDHEMTRTCETWAMMWWAILTTKTWLLDSAHLGSRLHSSVGVHVRCGRCSGSSCHVVIGVVLACITQTQLPWWWRCHWYRTCCCASSPRRRSKCRVFPSRFVVH